jgi:hypothetical protein
VIAGIFLNAAEAAHSLKSAQHTKDTTPFADMAKDFSFAQKGHEG